MTFEAEEGWGHGWWARVEKTERKSVQPPPPMPTAQKTCMWPWPTLKETKIPAASSRGRCSRSGRRTAVAGGSARSSAGPPPGRGGSLPTISERSPSLLPPCPEVLRTPAGFTHVFNMPLNLSFSTQLRRKEDSGELWFLPSHGWGRPSHRCSPWRLRGHMLVFSLLSIPALRTVALPPSSGTVTRQGLQNQNSPSGETAEGIFMVWSQHHKGRLAPTSLCLQKPSGFYSPSC